VLFGLAKPEALKDSRAIHENDLIINVRKCVGKPESDKREAKLERALHADPDFARRFPAHYPVRHGVCSPRAGSSMVSSTT
jgi:hypothetical protein